MIDKSNIESTNTEFEERFRLVLDNLNCAAYQIDVEKSKPVFLDGPFSVITGYEINDFLTGTISWSKIIHPMDLERFKKEHEKILNTAGYVANNEYRIIHKNGSEIWVNDIAQFVKSTSTGKGYIHGVLREITNRKIVRQNLITTQIALDNARDSIFWIGPDGSILYVNNAACEALEYTLEEILSLKIFDIDPLFNKDLWYEHWEKTRMFPSYKLESYHKSKSGRIFPVEVSISLIKSGDREFHSAYARDITDRKQAEEILKKYQQLLNESQRLAHVGSWELDVQTKKMFWSEENFRILGMENRSFQPSLKEFTSNVHPDDLNNVLRYFEKSIQTKSFGTFNYRILLPDNSIRWVQTTGNVHQGEDGTDLKIVGNIQDITERKKFENELIEKEHLLSNIIDFLPDATFVVNMQGKIIAWNKAIEEITCINKTDMLGKGNLEYAKAFYGHRRYMLIDYIFEKSKEILKLYDFVHIQGSRISAELQNPKIYGGKGGHFWATAAPLFDNNGNQIGAIESIRDITERKRAEQALAESEKKYRMLVNNLPDLIIVHVNGIIEYVNSSSSLMGYTIDEIKGTSIFEYVHKNDCDLVYKHTEQHKKELNVPDYYELRLITKYGEIKYAQVRVAHIKYGGKDASLVVITDISERKKIEQELRVSEDKFSKAFRTSPDAMNINRMRDGKYIETNSGFTELTGYTKDDIVGKTSFELNLWTNADDRKFLIKELLERGEVNNLEAQFRTKTGEIKTGLMSARLIELNGEICILSITRDITERKVAQEALSKSEAMLQSLVKSLPQNIFCKDREGRFTFVNENFCKTEGKSSEEIIGKNDYDFYDPKLAEKYIADDKTVIDSGQIFDGIESHETQDGKSFYAHIIKTPLYNLAGEIIGILGIFWDITEAKLAQEELIKAKNKAEISEQLKSAFLAQMSHEIRSPLYRILGYISLLKDYIKSCKSTDNEEVMEFFGSIDLSSKRLIRTIDSILNMSEIQTNSYSPTFQEINLFELLRGLRKEYLEQAKEKKLDLKLSALTDQTFVSCDEYSVTQIFANLIDNALKYTEKGCVKIIIDRDGENKLFVEINDSGIGISQEFLDQLFSPFTQEEMGYTRKFDGNGLGLALVKSYCEINHALVHVESKKGKGSNFRITFNGSQS